jgi:hypothetical protein
MLVTNALQPGPNGRPPQAVEKKMVAHPRRGGFIAPANGGGKRGGPPKAVVNIMAGPPQHPWKRKP